MHPALVELPTTRTIGRIVSVTGSKAIVMLEDVAPAERGRVMDRPEMGSLVAIDTNACTVVATVCALSVPVPATNGETEIRIAEVVLVGELLRDEKGRSARFERGTAYYPSLGDRVRLATAAELQLTYSANDISAVRVGSIRQDESIGAMVRIDDLLGKHFAVLGTTGTGKSCTVALLLKRVLEHSPNGHIVLIDPHNEYATSFGSSAEVITPADMQLPLWLLNFEEVVEVLVGDDEHKAEIEILQDLIPLAKGRYSAGRQGDQSRARRSINDAVRFTVDTPVPYRISDLTSLIDERMGKLENRKDLTPYRALKTRIETFSQDGRFSFMFGSVTVYDGMTQILSRLFRVPVNGKPITVIELTGIPPEVVNVVVSVICRLAFDFALWSDARIPVTVVCEEAHRYVPSNPSLGFAPCKRAISKIAREGRKYGCSLCIVSQRPAEIDPTILSQCSTVFSLRLTNDRDQEIIKSAVAGVESSLVAFLPSLGAREAIAFGDGVSLPTIIRFDELPHEALPRSATAVFSERWRASVGDERMLEQIVERWRMAGVCGSLDSSSQATLMAESLQLNGAAAAGTRPDRAAAERAERPVQERPVQERPPMQRPDLNRHAQPPVAAPSHHMGASSPAMQASRPFGEPPPPQPEPAFAHAAPQQSAPAGGGPGQISAARLSLRERLLRPKE